MRRANKIIIMLYYPTTKCFKEKIISIDMFVTPICHFHVPEIINH